MELYNKDTESEWQRIVTAVERHRAAPYRLPISSTMQAVLDPLVERLVREQQSGKRLLLDAGCGTAYSTCLLAEHHPDMLVVGIDRSLVRLRKAPPLPANALICRARLEEFWLLAHQAGILFERTYLLYPNPYPKRWQLGRRWYGHPIFPTILATTRSLELRTNQQWYAHHFCIALAACSWHYRCMPHAGDQPLTPFERKYLARGELCWIVEAWQK
ncbi:MAG: SAM-dependent methyltransferase [Bacteroidota bacterium]|nr:SAM-dependent methyltransferase [Candidatus Kapabacteria bacterium]MCS7303348.1 SAM-dependent methyltransferase [Candidatus Kapabacteria bacterium]MCX7937351.1 SAM-dependent methyltransferase [Chlorobiota bacterium]MDW8075872.1 SAM-dependent methyltransferase [Bacteroidota bacterium]MDW8271808.1 SAM-dependent methyltransferase [Bacteroidota bacterium]